MSVTIDYVKGLRNYCGQLGIDLTLISQHLHINWERLNDPDFKFPEEKFSKLIDYSIAKSGDPYFGLHFGLNFEYSWLGVLGFLMQQSRNGYELYQNLIKYEKIISQESKTSITELENSFLIYVCVSHFQYNPIERQSAFSIIGNHLKGIRGSTRENYMFKVLLLKSSPEEENDDYLKEFLAREIRYNQEFFGFEVEKNLLLKDFENSDPELRKYFSQIVESVYSNLDPSTTWTQKVKEQIKNETEIAGLTIETVADSLAVSVRSLQRYLSEENTQFSKILDEIKRDYAMRYLKSPHFSIGDIAYMLNFSEISAFNRSFKRWTGTSPSRFRKGA